MALPEKFHLDALRKLRGDASVTFPGGKLEVVRVERLETVPRGSTLPAFGSADVEYTGAKLVEQQILGGDANHVEVYRLWHTLPGVATTSHVLEEETRTMTAVTSQIIARPTASLLPENGRLVEYQPVNDVYGTLISTVICPDAEGAPQTPPGRVEYRAMDYTFPTLLKSLTAQSAMARDGSVVMRIVADRRQELRRQVVAKVEISYGAKEDLEEQLSELYEEGGIFQPLPQDLVYSGVAFDIAEQNVLNDAIPSAPAAGSIYYISGTENPKWPYFTEQYTASASTPSCTEYLAMVAEGEYHAVSASLQEWKAGWFKLEVVSVKLQ